VWDTAEYQAAAAALTTEPASFAAQHHLYLPWRAAAAAVEQCKPDLSCSRSWKHEFHHELVGPHCQAWLENLSGRYVLLPLLPSYQLGVLLADCSGSSIGNDACQSMLAVVAIRRCLCMAILVLFCVACLHSIYACWSCNTCHN